MIFLTVMQNSDDEYELILQKKKDLQGLETEINFLTKDIENKNKYYLDHGWNEEQFVDLMKEVAILDKRNNDYKALAEDISNHCSLSELVGALFQKEEFE